MPVHKKTFKKIKKFAKKAAKKLNPFRTITKALKPKRKGRRTGRQ